MSLSKLKPFSLDKPSSRKIDYSKEYVTCIGFVKFDSGVFGCNCHGLLRNDICPQSLGNVHYVHGKHTVCIPSCGAHPILSKQGECLTFPCGNAVKGDFCEIYEIYKCWVVARENLIASVANCGLRGSKKHSKKLWKKSERKRRSKRCEKPCCVADRISEFPNSEIVRSFSNNVASYSPNERSTLSKEVAPNFDSMTLMILATLPEEQQPSGTTTDFNGHTTQGEHQPRGNVQLPPNSASGHEPTSEVLVQRPTRPVGEPLSIVYFLVVWLKDNHYFQIISPDGITVESTNQPGTELAVMRFMNQGGPPFPNTDWLPSNHCFIAFEVYFFGEATLDVNLKKYDSILSPGKCSIETENCTVNVIKHCYYRDVTLKPTL